ncbi:UTP--glucose-1-phosphate uridylyltransferase GalU [Paenibacillus filicis]|uniref:UTP--glucose-1-phosphate uridylyltransferase n=1 Tax=Paenibacillus gyeongsangnamensis TaxID=3388067 RepID=A0ABT4Q8T6_9BACL|nr:UTP--glucose-1-phosphate uridylyltransferase GalU [Paenibacillus filicis]MCZ8513296.1 UTP--glucose-1-phosphate uridylyltransferase GalU [Paenibacillus filicis]
MTRSIRKAIIPAAGLGTRFLPATKAQPKEMLPIAGKPAIQYIVEEAVASGIESILIITGRGKRAMEDHFDKSFELEVMLEERGKTEQLEAVRRISNLADIHYIRQKEALGLGHAVLQAKAFVGDEPFAVLLGDDLVHGSKPCLGSMLELYAMKPASIAAVQQVPWEEVSKYGIAAPVRGALNTASSMPPYVTLEDLVEKPSPQEAPSNLAIIGRYVLEPDIFAALEKLEPGAGGEIQLTDALSVLNREKPMLAFPIQGERYDVGDKLGYLRANIEYALRDPSLKEGLEAYLRSLLPATPVFPAVKRFRRQST